MKLFQKISSIVVALSFSFFCMAIVSLIISIFVGVFTKIYYIIGIGGGLFIVFIIVFVAVVISMAAAFLKIRNKTVSLITAQLVPFFESENQRYYSSKGVPFKFSHEMEYMPENRSTTVMEWRPKLTIVMSDVALQLLQQQPAAQYYVSTLQEPVYHPPAQYPNIIN